MKLTQLLFLAAFGLTSLVLAEENSILPFPVKIGGQSAKAANQIFATIEKPVAADAEVEVEGQPQMLILNVFKSSPKGDVDNSAQPAIIMVQNSGKVKLDATMDKSKLTPGVYLANIVDSNKGATARVLFTVE